ncbi:MAG: GNAT family N-acetyltransferase [Legionellaceae bacterium]|nr:GNAT family N-acetyltransferase [Legionellaceae bacterium]
MLSRSQQLDHISLVALQSLLTACQAIDGHVIPTYPHLLAEHRQGPPSLLYYDEGVLVGFLAAFHFQPHTCEVSLLVDPNHRKQHIATALWHTMLSSVHAIRPAIKHLMISTPHDFNLNRFKHHDFHFQHSEFDMEYLSNTPPQLSHPSLVIRPAEHAHINHLCIIDKACFNPNRQHAELRFKRAIDNPDIHIFVAEHAGQVIGQVQLHFEKNQVRLTDLAVLPAWQGQGFGQAITSYCLNYMFKHNKNRMTLIVAAKNQQALRLYQNLGFKIYNAVDYYKHDLTDFKRDL